MLTLLLSVSFAAELAKSECKTFATDVKAAYPSAVWALKDLPVNSGFTMYSSWISPIAEVTPTTVKIEAKTGVSATIGSAQSVWFGVRPYETLSFKELECNDDGVVLAFIGTGASKGRDTKIKITSGSTLAEVKTSLDTVITASDPVDASWPDDVKTGVHNRTLVNGMSKKQAYLVVGEPIDASTKEEGGKKIETWKPRQDGGLRIGYGAKVESTGYPTEIHFEDGQLAGIATGSGGGVSLE